MTIHLENSAECAKFFAKCMAKKTCCRDMVVWNFDEVQMLTLFPQISVKTDKSTMEVENLLRENRIKFTHVSPF